jgi:hypothetical protein
MRNKFEKAVTSKSYDEKTKQEYELTPAFYDEIVQDVIMRLERENVYVKKMKEDRKKKKKENPKSYLFHM